jgi:hypothetical protein
MKQWIISSKVTAVIAVLCACQIGNAAEAKKAAAQPKAVEAQPAKKMETTNEKMSQDSTMEGMASSTSGKSTEFFYIAPAGKHVVTPFVRRATSDLDYKGNRTVESVDWTVGSAYEFGWMEGLSVGGELAYTVGENETTGSRDIEATGLENVKAFVKGSMPVQGVALQYGAELSISLMDNEAESNGDKNRFTGGHTLTPYFGVTMDAGAGTVGAKLAAELELGERDIDNASGADSTSEGGEETTFTVFYETEMNDFVVGGRLSLVSVSDRETKTSGTTSKAEALSPIYKLGGYGEFHVGPGMLVPELEIGMTSDDKSGGTKIEDYNEVEMKVGYRWTL